MKKSKKYYFVYLKKDLSLYAYTDDKSLYNQFCIYRDMDIFYTKKEMLNSDEIHNLFNDNRNYNMLINFEFSIDEYKFSMPITMCEKQAIEIISTKALTIDIYAYASIIPIEIFNKKLQKKLEIIGYKNAYDVYHGKAKPDNRFTQNYFGVFMKNYGFTMKEVDI